MTHSHDTSTPAMSAASHLAKEGGEAGAVERLHSTCTMGVGCETHGVCFADAHGQPDQCASLPQPSPALAKGGDAVREALQEWIERGFRKVEAVLAQIGPVQANTQRDQEEGRIPAYRYGFHVGFREALKDAQHIAALSTPTEGPASQTEGMGGVFNEWELGVLRQSASAKHLVYLGHHAAGGLKADEIKTMERWRALCDKLAALTPPETVEAVPGDPIAAYLAGVQRGREEIAHLREELERVTQERDDYLAAASDPAPATDDRERLVEALRPFANAVFNDNGDMTVSPVTDYDAYVNAYFVRRAALATEASR